MYRAAVQKGDGLSARPLADLLLSEGRREEPLGFYLQAAEQGDTVAMHQAAALFWMADCVEETLLGYGKATDQGDAASLVHIGVLHPGRGEVEAALVAFTKAADLRERDAYREAEWMLWDCGRLDRAFSWLGQRVERGDRRAVREMADLLREVRRLPEALERYLRSGPTWETCTQHATLRSFSRSWPRRQQANKGTDCEPQHTPAASRPTHPHHPGLQQEVSVTDRSCKQISGAVERWAIVVYEPAAWGVPVEPEYDE
ncbi:hypothetical protein ACFVSN_30410 [Kitasatospora sp. NPDC057904]|uniref:hypothetical protein n=1 Tax=unclassified Kitasatospora TaxID=2633591 RepID=UPI0036D902DB